MHVITYLALFLHQFEEEPGQDNFLNSRLCNDEVNGRLMGFLTGKVHKAQVILGSPLVNDHLKLYDFKTGMP